MTTTAPQETTQTTANGAPSAQPQQAAKPAAPIVHTSNTDVSRAINAFGSDANFQHAYRMARMLSTSTMVPKQYQGDANIPNCVIAMELSARIGASVFMVMQNLDIIHGRPGWRAVFLIATVNASGRFTPLRYRWEGEKGTDSWGCRAYAKDRETGEECPGALIDWKLVKAEGWQAKQGSKWLSMPEQMFMYRAAAFWTRAYAPELSLGIQTTEEVIDTVADVVSERVRPLPNGPGKELEDVLRGQATIATPTPPATTAPANDSNPAWGMGDAKPQTCFFCKEPVGDDGVDHEDSEGVVHRKHRACTAFGKGQV